MSTAAPPNSVPVPVPCLSISIKGKILLSTIAALLCLFIFLLILFLRANRYLGANPAHANPPARTIRTALPRRPLDPSVLSSLPTTVFNSAAFRDGVNCAVCLSDLADGDDARLLPGCRHGFHLKCIDVWFAANSTCPICRRSIKPPDVQLKNAIFGDLKQSAGIINRDSSGEGSLIGDMDIQRIV